MPPTAGVGMLSSGAGWQLKRIHFVPARQPDAHSASPAELGLIPLNDPVEVRRPAPVSCWQRARRALCAQAQPGLTLPPCRPAPQPADGSMGRPLPKAPKNGKLRAAELFSEADVLLRWSTVRKTVRGRLCMHARALADGAQRQRPTAPPAPTPPLCNACRALACKTWATRASW